MAGPTRRFRRALIACAPGAAQRAAERKVDADIVMTNDALMTIARAAPISLDALASLGVLGAWKLQEYGAELLRVLGAV